MKRSKIFAVILLVLLPLMFGCASNRKPKVIVDQPNNIPADIPSQFVDRYERFINGKERREFEKLSTDEQRQDFIDKFWAERDTDPSTPENEYKQKIDDRIDDIANERFFGSSGVTGLLFRTNGGFQGNMAKVYLLQGEPDAMDIIEGSSFVPMMLWVYVNSENGSILYAFLFYQKGGSGSYRILFQDFYQMDPCGAIYEIATTRLYNYANGGGQACPDDLYQIYNEIYRSSGKGGVLDGNIFAWALFNFSQDGSPSLQGMALDPPKPASQIAKQSKARVTGEASKLTGTAGTDYILASCDKCNSLIPAELNLGKEFVLLIKRSDIDWRVVGEVIETEFKSRVVLESLENKIPPLVFEGKGTFKDKKEGLHPLQGQVVVALLTTDETSQIPTGTYRVSVYFKNMMTKKYNAWSREFTK